MGLIMMTLAIRHAMELPPRLPRKIGDRPLPEAVVGTVAVGDPALPPGAVIAEGAA